MRRGAEGECDADGTPIVLVRTKSDLPIPGPMDVEALGRELEAGAAVDVSVETGAGVQRLLNIVGDTLSREAGAPELDAPLLTQARHQHAVAKALGELQDFRRVWRDEALPATIAAIHLHTAAEALRDLIGGVDIENVLDEVFRRFCVGK